MLMILIHLPGLPAVDRQRRRLPVYTVLVLLIGLLPLNASSSPDESNWPVLWDSGRAPGAVSAQILIVGDVSMARGIARLRNQCGSTCPLKYVSGMLQAADLSIGNYEGVLAADDVGARRLGLLRLRAEPDAAGILHTAGFGAFGLGNNHIMDWGPDGAQATVQAFSAVGIPVVGVGQGDSVWQPLILTIKGVRDALLSFYGVRDDTPDAADGWQRAWLLADGGVDRAVKAIQSARSQADVVFVLLHWGEQYVSCPLAWQVDAAQKLTAAGADIIAGSHPHVVQPVTIIGKSLVAYSLGNFLFDQPSRHGLGLLVSLDQAGVRQVQAVGFDSGWQPLPLSVKQTQNALPGPHFC